MGVSIETAKYLWRADHLREIPATVRFLSLEPLLGLCLLFIHPPAHGSEVSPAGRNTLDSARIPTASKLLICGLFQKGRVLAQDGKRTYGAASEALPQETGRNR